MRLRCRSRITNRLEARQTRFGDRGHVGEQRASRRRSNADRAYAVTFDETDGCRHIHEHEFDASAGKIRERLRARGLRLALRRHLEEPDPAVVRHG